MSETNSESEAAKPSRSGLGIIFMTVFIDLLGFGIVLPLLPRYGKHFEADGWTLGLLMASFSAMQFLFAPIWGRISDRVGRRPILILGLAGSTASYALFGYATGLGSEGVLLGLGVMPWLFISRIGAGIAGATIPTAQAYIADVTGERERGKGMALIGAAFGIGFTFGPLIGAAFVSGDADAAPSPYPGYVAAVLSGLAMLSAIFRLPESLKSSGKPTQAASSGWFALRRFQQAVGVSGVGMILATVFITTFAFAQFESTLALLTRLMGMADRQNFFVFAYIGFILSLAQGMLVRRLMPKLGEFRMAMIGTVLMTVGMMAIGIAANSESPALLFAIVPVAVVGFSALTPSLQSLLSLRSADSDQGGILGVSQSISALARILGPGIGLPLFGLGASIPYWTGAGLMAAGTLMVFSLRSVAKREPLPQES